MDKLIKLCSDIARLWGAYAPSYLNGVKNTLILAIVATLLGCIIGLVCGVLNTIPYSKNDPAWKRFLLKAIRVLVRIYVEIFRGTPHGAAGSVYLLRPALLHRRQRGFQRL